MHVALQIGDTLLMGTDALESQGFKLTSGNNFSLSWMLKAKRRQIKTFAALSAGGQAAMPMENTFWGSYFGMLTDKFGIQWMISFSEKQPK